MKNIFDDIPNELPHEVFSDLLNSDGVKIERIISKGHKSPKDGWYDQTTNEWLILIQGSATLIFENKPTLTLETGDYLNIPAHQKHKVSWTDPSIETIWLTVHY